VRAAGCGDWKANEANEYLEESLVKETRRGTGYTPRIEQCVCMGQGANR
jgi:hypothetical protein